MNRKMASVILTHSYGQRRNPPVLVWPNSHTSWFPKTSRVKHAAIGKRWVNILSQLVATLFLRKGKLVRIYCGSHKNCNSRYNMKGDQTIVSSPVSHVLAPGLLNLNHFQGKSNLVRWSRQSSDIHKSSSFAVNSWRISYSYYNLVISNFFYII
jgi:hypothetical protein